MGLDPWTAGTSTLRPWLAVDHLNGMAIPPPVDYHWQPELVGLHQPEHTDGLLTNHTQLSNNTAQLDQTSAQPAGAALKQKREVGEGHHQGPMM